MQEQSLFMLEKYLNDDVVEIVNDCFDHINNMSDKEEIKEALDSFFNKAYLIGYKTALVDRVEEDLQTLEFITRERDDAL